MGDVQRAAIALFMEGFKDVGSIKISWTTPKTSCSISHGRGDGTFAFLTDLYFHSSNVIADLTGETGLKRFVYADPAYPYNLIGWLYQRIRGWLTALGGDGFEEKQKVIDLLLAQNE